MEMLRTRKITLDHERKLLMNAITSTEFLQAISPILRPKLLKASYARLVSGWILEYWGKYERAPGPVIEDIYFDRKGMIPDEDDVGLIREFLSSLSEEYTRTVRENPKYAIEQATEYLRTRNLELFREELSACVELGKLADAEAVIAGYSKIDQMGDKGISVLTAVDEAEAAFSGEGEVLFEFPGVFGETLGPFVRGDFYSFLAFAKRGKSYALSYTAETAALAGCRVLEINLEITLRQILRRKWMSFTGRPRTTRYVTIPYFEELPGEPEGKKWAVGSYSEEREGLAGEREVFEQVGRRIECYSGGGEIRLLTPPAKSMTVSGLRTELKRLEFYENFVPDVVVIDYADLLESEKVAETRHQLDDIWAGLRRLALERNICIFTASQGNRGSANNDVSEESVAEDIRKIAHVSRMIGINQNRKNRADQVYRVRVIADREGLSRQDDLLVLSCLDIGRFILDARLLKEVEYDNGTSGKKDFKKFG